MKILDAIWDGNRIYDYPSAGEWVIFGVLCLLPLIFLGVSIYSLIKNKRSGEPLLLPILSTVTFFLLLSGVVVVGLGYLIPRCQPQIVVD